MALSKKTKRIIVWAAGLVFTVFVLPRLVSDFKLRGSWNGQPLSQLKASYPGLRAAILGNTVTVSSRPDLKGTLAGNVITWSNGTTWTRG